MTVITGTPIRQDAESFTVQEGDAVATYNRRYYRLDTRPEAEPIVTRLERQLPIELIGSREQFASPAGRATRC
ncbi:hypothetical protein J2Z47_003765 [Cohnella thailandensis]|nr:hypothetical protein [Cohnella thailandensis]